MQIRTAGKVKWFNETKGYGFLTSDTGQDIFVHKSDVPSSLLLTEGTRVEFEIGQSPRGTKAVNLQPE